VTSVYDTGLYVTTVTYSPGLYVTTVTYSPEAHLCKQPATRTTAKRHR